MKQCKKCNSKALFKSIPPYETFITCLNCNEVQKYDIPPISFGSLEGYWEEKDVNFISSHILSESNDWVIYKGLNIITAWQSNWDRFKLEECFSLQELVNRINAYTSIDPPY